MSPGQNVTHPAASSNFLTTNQNDTYKNGITASCPKLQHLNKPPDNLTKNEPINTKKAIRKGRKKNANKNNTNQILHANANGILCKKNSLINLIANLILWH